MKKIKLAFMYATYTYAAIIAVKGLYLIGRDISDAVFRPNGVNAWEQEPEETAKVLDFVVEDTLEEREEIRTHPCEAEGCSIVVQYDDEPFCFDHSSNEGSMVPGYSYKETHSQEETK